jgi:hypothetical protein
MGSPKTTAGYRLERLPEKCARSRSGFQQRRAKAEMKETPS